MKTETAKGCSSCLEKFIVLLVVILILPILIYVLFFYSIIPFYFEADLVTGNSVALHENTLAIGSSAYNNSVAYVLLLEEKGDKWVQKDLFNVSNIGLGNYDSMYLALSDDYLAVGFSNFSIIPGYVLTFYKDGKNGKWKRGKKILMTDDCCSLSLGGNKLLVGDTAGKVYLYELAERKIKLKYKFHSPDKDNEGVFGSYTSISKDEIIISDSVYNRYIISKSHIRVKEPPKSAEGKVYFYKKIDNDYILEKTIAAENFIEYAAGRSFGEKFVKNNDIIIVHDSEELFAFDVKNDTGKPLWTIEAAYNFDSYGNKFITTGQEGVKLYTMNKNGINLINTFDYKSAGFISAVPYITDEFMILSDKSIYDNIVEREKLKTKADKEGRKEVIPEIENQGRVHIYRLLPDYSYTEEAIIARRKNTQTGKLEFYNMLEKTDLPNL